MTEIRLQQSYLLTYAGLERRREVDKISMRACGELNVHLRPWMTVDHLFGREDDSATSLLHLEVVALSQSKAFANGSR
jgi:hypothetical protein